MLPKKMLEYGTQRSVIREVYEEDKKLKHILGDDRVYDFSLGNPSIEPPEILNKSLIKLLGKEDTKSIHGYTSNAGDIYTRTVIANYLNNKYSCNESEERIYMTCGAAASLTITLHSLVNPGEEVVLLAPFFAEYRVFVEKANGVVKIARCREEDLQIDIKTLNEAISEKTKAIIVNSPNNPTGVVYSKDSLEKLSKLLEEKEKEYNHPIYVISDEPYRELVYDGLEVPYMAKYIKNTISCYSFSKALSIPGERIGYICVTEKCENGDEIFLSIQGAGRALGYVCAPSLFQKVIPYVIGKTADISIYDRNRKLLYDIVTKAGFSAIYPQGAFYLFIKSPDKTTRDFCDKAKKYNILFVRGDEFGDDRYIRCAYCVDTKTIENSRISWELLGEEK